MASDRPVQQIKALRRKSNDALKRRDLQAFLSSMHPDIIVTVGSGEHIIGRTAIEETMTILWRQHPDMLFVRAPGSVKMSRSGTPCPLAAEQGTWHGTWTDGDLKIENTGVYNASWRQEGGIWLLRAELFVTLSGTDAS